MNGKFSCFTLLVCFLPLSAAADVVHTRAGFDCQPGRDRLILTYDVAANYAGEKMAEKAKETQWDPEVTYDEKGFVSNMRRERGVCVLSDGEYQIEIRPNPGNANVQGHCGAWVGAGARVEKDGKTLFDENFDECRRPDWPTTRRVLIRPGKEPVRRVGDESLGLMFTAACQPEHGELRLSFVFGSLPGWRQETPGVNAIEDLLWHMDGSDNFEAFDLEASCRLRDGEYRYEYRYVLHPFFSEGEKCGAARWANAQLTILKDGETIYDAPFMGNCGVQETPVIRSVTLNSFGNRKFIEVETLPAALFFDPDDDPEEGVYSPVPEGEE